MSAQLFTDILEIHKNTTEEPPETVIKSTEEPQQFNIMKTDDDKRLIFGWASVAITKAGEQVVDHQKDIIDPDDLEEAVYKYVLDFRDGGEEHIPNLRKKARMVESCMFTKEKMQAMGIPEGIVPEGWWIGFYVDDDEAWEKVKNGTYQMFSVEGHGIREEVDDEEEEEEVKKNDRINGCGVLVVSDGKILTGTRIDGKHKNQICGPGGHIENGEEPEEAAIREAYEEFGIECKKLNNLGILDGGRNYGKSAIFLCTEYEGEPQTDEEEMTDCKWRTIEEISKENLYKPFEQSLKLLDDLEEYLGLLQETSPLERPSVAKTFDDILKFNPYHDSLGRFSTASGYASFTTTTRDPKKQHWADKAVARMKQQAAQAAPAAPPKPPKPQKNFDKLGFADHDDADFHQLYNGKQYYQQQKLTAAQKQAVDNYLEAHTEPGSLYSHSQNMNWQMVNGQTLTGKYKKTHDGLMSAMHNLGYNVELTRYDHDEMLNGMLKAVGSRGSVDTLTVGQIKKALVGSTMNENKFLSVSYNDFNAAPVSSTNVFTNRRVKVTYRAKASTQAMMPGNGPGGNLGELILAPTNGKDNPGGKIVDVKLSGRKARNKGTQIMNKQQIEIVVEI